jgi:hypothetical protein
MNVVPLQINEFLQRDVPIFAHLASAQQGEVPLICRGYGFRFVGEDSLMWIYILKSQWVRLSVYMKHPKAEASHLAALLTSGIDNESYQFKGLFMESRRLTIEDIRAVEEQRAKVARHMPGLAPMIQAAPEACMAVGFQVHAVYSQTPGPGAGSVVMERGMES